MSENESVEIPKNIMKNIKFIVKENEGLFEDETDYIIHSIVDQNSKFR